MCEPWLSPDVEKKNSYERQFEDMDNWRNVNIDQGLHDIRKLLILLGRITVLRTGLYVGDEYSRI